MRKNPRRILSPQRLPFRHPGALAANLSYQKSYCNMDAASAGCSKSVGVSSTTDEFRQVLSALSFEENYLSCARGDVSLVRSTILPQHEFRRGWADAGPHHGVRS
jgi:hypothetical protein